MDKKIKINGCPLCHSMSSKQYFEDRHLYWQCAHCSLVYVDPAMRLNAEQEKAEYDLHQNSYDDHGYRDFLLRLIQPMSDRISPGDKGLDFGCGPGPTLSLMFRERGIDVADYDIFYANKPELLNQYYDFICATEVVEHLFNPGDVIKRLWRQLVVSGYLGIMTKQVIDQQSFANWHYKNDPTHVCFFSRETFHYLAEQLNARLEFIGNDVIIFTKQ